MKLLLLYILRWTALYAYTDFFSWVDSFNRIFNSWNSITFNKCLNSYIHSLSEAINNIQINQSYFWAILKTKQPIMCQSTDLRVRLFPERSVQAILEVNKNHSKENMLKQKLSWLIIHYLSIIWIRYFWNWLIIKEIDLKGVLLYTM